MLDHQEWDKNILNAKKEQKLHKSAEKFASVPFQSQTFNHHNIVRVMSQHS